MGYCVFGKVVEGIEVVVTIEKLPTTIKNGYKGVPVSPLIIERITIEE